MYTARFILSVITLTTIAALDLSADEIILTDGGKSDYRIVVAINASLSTRHGAEELQKFIKEITDTTLPIVSDKQPMTDREIIIGNNIRFATKPG